MSELSPGQAQRRGDGGEQAVTHRVTVSRLGVAPNEVAYFGDAPSDMRAARSAGVLAVAAG